jgi:glutamyl-tRNA reductase
LRQQELSRAMQHLSPTLSEREMAVVQELSTRLMNKLLHTPMVRLKAAAADGQGHIYAEALRYLFDLEEKMDEAHNIRDTGQQAGDDTDPMGSRTATGAMADPGYSY